MVKLQKMETNWAEIKRWIEKLAECAEAQNYSETLSVALAIVEALEESNLKEGG